MYIVGNYVDFIEEIRNRLDTAIGSGKTLEDVTRVRIGSVEELRKHNDLPIINIRVLSGEEIATAMNAQGTTLVTVEIKLVYSKLAEALNTLYKTSDTSGSLYMLELLLNALDNNTSDALDLQFASTVNNLRTYSWDIAEGEDVVEITVSMEAETLQFTLGGR